VETLKDAIEEMKKIDQDAHTAADVILVRGTQ